MYSELAMNIIGKYSWKERNLMSDFFFLSFLENEVCQPLKD